VLDLLRERSAGRIDAAVNSLPNLAYAAQQRKAPIPAFMEPVTNFGLVEDRLAQWRREREIERWTKALGNLHLLMLY
jgi:ABC-type amino acid transport substrate-binding protein